MERDTYLPFQNFLRLTKYSDEVFEILLLLLILHAFVFHAHDLLLTVPQRTLKLHHLLPHLLLPQARTRQL